ncbi:hypothetical protein D1007_07714 [Hordeum vulgare]|nr:hypothetical protein D1007_07714 [Hordeum vulgare]
MDAGTYSFDRKSSAWSKAGEWALTFRDCAVYDPEHSLWFGFSASDGQLCATDMTLTTTAPALEQVWEDDLPPLEAWIPTGSTSCRWALASSVSGGFSKDLSGGT